MQKSPAITCVGWLLLYTAALFLPHSQLYAAWDITQFEVVQGEPGSLLDAFAEGLGFVDLDEQYIAEVEQYLAEVAREYSRLGFRAPAIDARSQGGYAYQVYLFDFDDDASPAGYSVSCVNVDANRYIRIDSSRIMKGGSIDPKFLEHLAHELFHAVQGSYDLFYRNCDLGDWIVEGTAEAIGIDTAFKLRKSQPPEIRVRLGGRAYINPLRVADDDTARKDEGYWTSSLWRYIGEYATASASGGRPGTLEIPADYRYLPELFARNLQGPADVGSELDWLDQGLEAITGLGLERIYPNFVTTFASYVPARGGKEENTAAWKKWLFEECPRVSLSSSKQTGEVSRGLGKVTAGCFELDIAISDWVDVALQVDNVDFNSLKSLSIGTADGTKVGQATIVENPAKPGTFFGNWLFRVPGNAPQVFVISNVAGKASETRTLTPTVHISLSSWQSNMTNPKSQVLPAGPKQGTGGLRPDPTAKKIAAELKDGSNSLSAHVAGGATTHLNPDEDICAEAFVYRACGPHTTINLSLMPGSMAQLNYINGTGGMIAQLLGTFSGMAEAGAEELGASWLKSAETMANTDGAEIHMVIPLIDYGFSGTFNNAAISVSGAGDASYYSQGPRDGIPGPEIAFPLSGTVTIENYTPFSLQGTFSAQLVDVNQIPVFEVVDPVLDVHSMISGSFNIVNPWQGDRRAKVYSDTEQAAADIQETFPGLSQDGDTPVFNPDNAQNAMATASGGTGPSAGLKRCDCSCNQAENPEPRCVSACGSSYTACAGIKREAPVKTATQVNDENMEIEALRAQFITLLESLGFSEDMLIPMLESFDQQQDLNAKKMMILSYGGVPGG